MSAVVRRLPVCFLSASLMFFSVCLLPGEPCISHTNTPCPVVSPCQLRSPCRPSQIRCPHECWNDFLGCVMECWRAHQRAQQNKTPGASMSPNNTVAVQPNVASQDT